ncbi:heat shock protein HtpX [Tepidamorphus gemmatus]|uniref:Heat shock protein HtpX n=1 Tax=Tepidamorphus gemmatus TaxID=747076 RepID=A0A4R3MH50_9HYPH|nr:zinc metalloprotease HtpX [Tepidamorphus gemmatus]TCT12488.1 heat shock protein HtpX [Tepidamorphus gemmatus]
MTSVSTRHRLLNLAQSVLLLGAMAAIAWISVTAIVGPEIGLIMALGMVAGLLLTPALPGRLLLSAYQAQRLTGRDGYGLVAAVAELARRAGLPRVPALYRVPSRLPNAFATGNPEDSAICITDGLLDLLDGRELAGVLAHEVGHIANHDLWIMGLADVMTRLVSLASWIGQLLLIMNLPLVLAGMVHVPWHVVILLIFAPTLMALVQLGLSRTREYDADRVAAELTGDPEGLIRALSKLERKVGRFWEEILLPGRRIPDPSLLRTHPPTESRIRRLRELTLNRPSLVPAIARHPVGMLPPTTLPPRFRRFGVYW